MVAARQKETILAMSKSGHSQAQIADAIAPDNFIAKHRKHACVITTKDLLRTCGLTRRTLSKYTALGLLPAPEIRATSGQRGVNAYWPDDTPAVIAGILARNKNKSQQVTYKPCKHCAGRGYLET